MTITRQVLLTVLLLYVALVHGIPPAIEKSRNTSLLGVVTDYSNLSSPLLPAPPGFESLLHWDASVALSPIAVYVTAIKLMYGLSQQPWSNTVELEHSDLYTVSQPGYNVAIYTNDSPPSIELTTGLVVRALYGAVSFMTIPEGGFYKVTINLKLQGQLIGRIRITILASSPSPVSSDSHASSKITSMVDVLAEHETQSVNASLVTYSDEIIDPEDERFKVSFQYVGHNIRSQDMFSAVLAGLTEVAQYDSDRPCPWITAVSSSGNVVFHIVARPRQALMGWHISRAFYLLVYHLFLVQLVLKEMRFSLVYYGTPIAVGHMKILRSEGVDAGAGATASE